MDFQALQSLLPKPSQTWTVNDIQTWLNFIGLTSHAPRFISASVDGSCLADLTEEDLRHELGINSNIIVKKLMLWITKGIRQYDEYLMSLSQRNRLKQTFTSKAHFQRSQLKSRQCLQRSGRMLALQKWQQPLSQLKLSYPPPKRQTLQHSHHHLQHSLQPIQKPHQKPQQINQLIIKQCQASINCCFSLKQHGGMIGRNSKCQIHVVDQNVSRYHAEIVYQGAVSGMGNVGKYYIRDCGSSSGTFIRISEKTELKHNVIVEMGSNQFLVDLSNAKNLNLKVIEGPNIGEEFNHATAKKGKSNIGRKTTNQISFPQDQHLSNMHSTLFTVEGIWYIQDLGTTNGTWIRLSPEGVKSQEYPLQNGTQFKLGSSLTYECQLTQFNRKTEKQKSDKCTFCRLSEKDCIFLPCKHNVACQRCVQEQELNHCIICGSEICEVMKIYKQ